MFVGAINQKVRNYLAAQTHVLKEQTVVVGRSGNFTIEKVLAASSQPAAIHSNDVSLYSCALGTWLAGGRLPFTVREPDYRWLEPYLSDDLKRLAMLMVLFEMLRYEKQNNPHSCRMWDLHRDAFPDLVAETAERLGKTSLRLTSFYAGDVLEHFQRFADQDVIYCCYAPTYAGGYEKMYTRLEEIFAWKAPTYLLLDDARRDALLKMMQEKRYLWFDDHQLEGLKPVLELHTGNRRTVWLYSNVVEQPGLFVGFTPDDLPPWPVATYDNLTLTPDTVIRLVQIPTTTLRLFKDAYLGKDIDHAMGSWAFAVLAGDVVIGFLEYRRGNFRRDNMYMMADFCVPGTKYRRLSKLIVMLGCCGQTRAVLERLVEYRLRSVCTTAFTDRPVSMKYRGVMEMEKRGQTEDGQKFLNYGQAFNDLSWQEVMREWLPKHGSKLRSTT
jgi:hypothetical protein